MQNFSNASKALITSLFLLVTFLLLVDLNSFLRFDPHAIAQGEAWRLVSAHFVHLNWVHGVLNLSVLALFLISFGRDVSTGRWCVVLFLLCIFVSLGLFWLSPNIVGYVGFSGVLHGLMVFALLGGSRKRDFFQMGLLAVLVIKVAREQMPGFDVRHLQHLIEGAVVVDAHLYGAVGGGVLFGVYFIKERFIDTRGHTNS